MEILLHTCCAPCSVACVESLREDGYEPTAFWYNPNIHPYTEYKARLDTMTAYAEASSLPFIMINDYGLISFLNGVYPNYEDRCGYCYKTRLFAAARVAAEQGFGAFTTTLLISPYQKHELIIETANSAAEEYGVEFLYRDFRPLFKQGQARARALGFYMQKYCGCIFSERERYLKK